MSISSVSLNVNVSLPVVQDVPAVDAALAPLEEAGLLPEGALDLAAGLHIQNQQARAAYAEMLATTHLKDGEANSDTVALQDAPRPEVDAAQQTHQSGDVPAR